MHEVVTNNLDRWTSALLTKATAGRGNNGVQQAYGIKKLRQLILELAVHGKLVPQDPTDEPASALLKRISKQREELGGEGKTKKQTAILPIAIEDHLFEIPTSWSWVRFGGVADFSAGRTPSRDDFSFWNTGDYHWVSIADMQDGEEIFSTKETISEKARKQVFGSEPACVGTLIMSFKLTIGKISRLGIPAFHNEAIISIYPYLSALDPYLFKVLPNFSRQGNAKDAIKGATLNRDSITNILLPLPPLAEQHRIVVKIDELMALCDQLERQQTHSLEAHQTLVETLLDMLTRLSSAQELTEAWTRLANHFDTLFSTEESIDQLKQSILQLAVMGKLLPQNPKDEPAGALLVRVKAAREQLVVERQIRQSDEAELSEPAFLFDVPNGWVWVHVKDIAIVQGGKRLPNGAVLLETPTPHIYIRVTDMKNGTVSETGLMYISSEVQRQISRYTINKEDLYITIAGTIGDVGTIPDSLDGQNLTENAAKLVFRDLDKRFLHLALSSKFVQAQFLEKTKQMAQPKLALKRIAGAKFCLPPLNEQHRIVAKVDELIGLCDALKAALIEAQTTQVCLANAIVEQAVA